MSNMLKWRKRALILGLAIGLLLPILCGSTTTAAETADAPLQKQVLDLANPSLQAMMARVKYAYEIRYGNGTAVEFPQSFPIVQLLGRDSHVYGLGCHCYGVTMWTPGSTDVIVVIMQETGEWSNDYVLAHELTHVLQVMDGRWTADARESFEEEADIIAQVVTMQLAADNVPPVLGD